MNVHNIFKNIGQFVSSSFESLKKIPQEFFKKCKSSFNLLTFNAFVNKKANEKKANEMKPNEPGDNNFENLKSRKNERYETDKYTLEWKEK